VNNCGDIKIGHFTHTANHPKLEDDLMENSKEPKSKFITLFQRKWREQSHKDKLYWLKSLFAIVGAVVSTIIRPVLFSPLLDSPFSSVQHPALIAAIIGVLILIGLPILLSYFYLKIIPDQVGGWTPYFTTGLLTALFLWLTIWTVLYNIILSTVPAISIIQILKYVGLLPPY